MTFCHSPTPPRWWRVDGGGGVHYSGNLSISSHKKQPSPISPCIHFKNPSFVIIDTTASRIMDENKPGAFGDVVTDRRLYLPPSLLLLQKGARRVQRQHFEENASSDGDTMILLSCLFIDRQQARKILVRCWGRLPTTQQQKRHLVVFYQQTGKKKKDERKQSRCIIFLH